MADPLLHSLSELSELFEEVLEVRQARSACEIGSQAGVFSATLADWVIGRGGRFDAVEPHPSDLVRERERELDGFHLHAGRSVDVLESVPACDLWIVDGEHNYFTVDFELRAIERICAGHEALVVCHDVGWPFGRRDGYFSPELFPEGTVHPHSFSRGVTLDEPGLVEGGFRSHGAFSFAEREGGARNGVRTAIDDFLAERPHLDYREIPSVFGLGFLFPRSAPWAEGLRALLHPYSEQPFLVRLERNRLELYLRVLDLQDELRDAVAAAADHGGLVETLDALVAHRDDVVAERDTLAAELALRDAELAHANRRLGEHVAEHEALAQRSRTLDATLAGGWWRLGAPLRRIRRRL